LKENYLKIFQFSLQGEESRRVRPHTFVTTAPLLNSSFFFLLLVAYFLSFSFVESSNPHQNKGGSVAAAANEALLHRDPKFQKWLHSTIPEVFHPHYSSFSSSSSSSQQQHQQEYKSSRRDRAGRRRRGHNKGGGGVAQALSEEFPEEQQRLHTLSKNISTILNSLAQNYDKRVRPNYGGEPVEVGVTMYVLSISSISEVLMDFTLDFYFRQMWKDPRLAFEGTEGISTLSVRIFLFI
jgi:hypothetical protein